MEEKKIIFSKHSLTYFAWQTIIKVSTQQKFVNISCSFSAVDFRNSKKYKNLIFKYYSKLYKYLMVKLWNIDKFFYQNLKRKMEESVWTWMDGNKIFLWFIHTTIIGPFNRVRTAAYNSLSVWMKVMILVSLLWKIRLI